MTRTYIYMHDFEIINPFLSHILKLDWKTSGSKRAVWWARSKKWAVSTCPSWTSTAILFALASIRSTTRLHSDKANENDSTQILAQISSCYCCCFCCCVRLWVCFKRCKLQFHIYFLKKKNNKQKYALSCLFDIFLLRRIT